jgi:capsular polysaccharide biosynthesis protein
MLLQEVDETTVLPRRSSASELLATQVGDGWCEVAPYSESPASAWYPEAIGRPGGDYVPPWWTDDPQIICRAVTLVRVRDAYYVPAFGTIISSSGAVWRSSFEEARYWTPSFDRLPYVSVEPDGSIMSVPTDVPSLDSAIVTMPWGGIHNYGHFVLDCLPGAAVAVDTSLLTTYPRVFPPLTPWHRRHLELLGVSDPLELDGSMYLVRDLVFSNCMACFLHHPNITYRRVRDIQLKRRNQEAPPAFDKVYVSRRGLAKRALTGEEQLEDRLRAEGFAIVSPEEHSIDEQINLFHNARVVVACAGAALANLLYCCEGTVVVEITPARMVEAIKLSGMWVYNLCCILRCRWRPYYSSAITVTEAVTVGGRERPELGFTFVLDLDAFVDWLRDLISRELDPPQVSAATSKDP